MEITKDILDSTPDGKLEDLLLNYTVSKLGFINETKKYYEAFRSLPFGLQMVYATTKLEMEVHNGGFAQYFWNISGIFVEEAIEGYRKLGATEHARIVEIAYTAITQELPVFNKYRGLNTLEAFSEFRKESQLGSHNLDDQFFNIEKSEDVKELRIKYVKENWGEFVAA